MKHAVMASLLFLLFWNCGNNALIQDNWKGYGKMVIMRDGSDPRLSHYYIYHDRRIFAVVSDFMTNSNAKYYYCENPSSELCAIIVRTAERKTGIKPPFSPGGPWFCFEILEAEKRRDIYFDREHKDIYNLMHNIRNLLINPKYSVKQIPDWVMENERAKFYATFK